MSADTLLCIRLYYGVVFIDLSGLLGHFKFHMTYCIEAERTVSICKNCWF